MAVTFQSVQTAGITSNSVVVTKPTSTAEGDLLVASFWYKDSGRMVTPPSGWILEESGGSNQEGAVYTKTAGVSEPANYTWSVDGASVAMDGSITRITGQASTSPVYVTTSDTADVTGSTGSLTYTYTGMALTPANSTSNLLLFFNFLKSSSTVGSPSASGYAIENDDPTWTERFEDTIGAADNIVAMATAVRSEQTSTGVFSATSTLHSNGAVGFAVAVLVVEDVNITVSPAVIEATATINAPAVAGGANVTPAVIEAIATIQAPTVTTEDSKITNMDKNSVSSITNLDKS